MSVHCARAAALLVSGPRIHTIRSPCVVQPSSIAAVISNRSGRYRARTYNAFESQTGGKSSAVVRPRHRRLQVIGSGPRQQPTGKYPLVTPSWGRGGRAPALAAWRRRHCRWIQLVRAQGFVPIDYLLTAMSFVQYHHSSYFPLPFPSNRFSRAIAGRRPCCVH